MDILEKSERPVYIVGHKNPDTDSICSAIAYAYLKNACGDKEYIPARAGQINQETQYVLNAFHVDAPMYLNDVMTDARDIDMNDVEGVTADVSLKKAWHLMRDRGDVTLPVLKEGKLIGIITIGDIANAYMDVYDNCILATAKTSYKNILETLDAKMIVGSEDGYFESGEVVIATANPDVLEDYIHKGDMVILGNRYETQLCAIEMGAACVVISMGAKVSKTIQHFAKEHNCIVINTPYDSFTVARLINQSMSIGYFMKKDKLTTFRVTDKTEDIKAIMKKKRYHDFPVLDEEDNYVGMISRRTLLNLRKKRLILVDHNETAQAVDGIEFAEILEIIDHHRLGSLETMSPVFFRNQPLGSTSSIIWKMYQEMGVEVDEKIAGLLCAAIISDTLMFRSPTCTASDKEAAEQLAKIAGIDIQTFASNMFRAGSDFSKKSIEEICYLDFKTFTAEKITFGVSQISAMSSLDLADVKQRVQDYLDTMLLERKLDMVFVMLTNIVLEQSEILCAGEGASKVLGQAFRDATEEQDEVLLRGVVSRKKQFIPELIRAMQES